MIFTRILDDRQGKNDAARPFRDYCRIFSSGVCPNPPGFYKIVGLLPFILATRFAARREHPTASKVLPIS
jgi:hypothetical protein